MTSLADNLSRVRERIAAAARRAGRNPDEITLVAVTKTHPPEMVQAARELGVLDVGENRVEEALPKMQAVGSGLRWHMIGHVQSRKAQEVARQMDFVHSVDSLKLARRLDQFAARERAGRRLPALVECNVSGEASKSGYAAGNESEWERLLPDMEALASLSSLAVRGLMTMAPFGAPPADIRLVFQTLARLRDFLARRIPAGEWADLSMGMTDDFEIGIEEGATFVRVGRAIFGERR